MAPRRKRDYADLCAFALAFPGATEHFPWGERVVKVNKKVFVFLGREENPGLGFSVKLPESGAAALSFGFASPTGYGLGKSGWVSVKLEAKDAVPVDLFKDWITESYRAVAPKKLVAALDGAASPPKTPKRKKR